MSAVATTAEAQAVNRILRVDHAGERGAICIYQAQAFVARFLWPACVPALNEMLLDERKHFHTFDTLLRTRGVRHCHALTFWALGGTVLGFLTALAGQRAIWVCTAAIENTVNGHLDHQIEFLRRHDLEALAAVQSIQRDEQAHEDHAIVHGGEGGGFYKLLRWIIQGATSFAIWLSTKL